MSVGRLSTKYAVNRLLIEEERLEECWRGQQRRNMKEKKKEMREEY